MEIQNNQQNNQNNIMNNSNDLVIPNINEQDLNADNQGNGERQFQENKEQNVDNNMTNIGDIFNNSENNNNVNIFARKGSGQNDLAVLKLFQTSENDIHSNLNKENKKHFEFISNNEINENNNINQNINNIGNMQQNSNITGLFNNINNVIQLPNEENNINKSINSYKHINLNSSQHILNGNDDLNYSANNIDINRVNDHTHFFKENILNKNSKLNTGFKQQPQITLTDVMLNAVNAMLKYRDENSNSIQDTVNKEPNNETDYIGLFEQISNDKKITEESVKAKKDDINAQINEAPKNRNLRTLNLNWQIIGNNFATFREKLKNIDKHLKNASDDEFAAMERLFNNVSIIVGTQRVSFKATRHNEGSNDSRIEVSIYLDKDKNKNSRSIQQTNEEFKITLDKNFKLGITKQNKKLDNKNCGLEEMFLKQLFLKQNKLQERQMIESEQRKRHEEEKRLRRIKEEKEKKEQQRRKEMQEEEERNKQMLLKRKQEEDMLELRNRNLKLITKLKEHEREIEDLISANNNLKLQMNKIQMNFNDGRKIQQMDPLYINRANKEPNSIEHLDYLTIKAQKKPKKSENNIQKMDTLFIQKKNKPELEFQQLGNYTVKSSSKKFNDKAILQNIHNDIYIPAKKRQNDIIKNNCQPQQVSEVSIYNEKYSNYNYMPKINNDLNQKQVNISNENLFSFNLKHKKNNNHFNFNINNNQKNDPYSKSNNESFDSINNRQKSNDNSNNLSMELNNSNESFNKFLNEQKLNNNPDFRGFKSGILSNTQLKEENNNINDIFGNKGIFSKPQDKALFGKQQSNYNKNINKRPTEENNINNISNTSNNTDLGEEPYKAYQQNNSIFSRNNGKNNIERKNSFNRTNIFDNKQSIVLMKQPKQKNSINNNINNINNILNNEDIFNELQDKVLFRKQQNKYNKNINKQPKGGSQLQSKRTFNTDLLQKNDNSKLLNFINISPLNNQNNDINDFFKQSDIDYNHEQKKINDTKNKLNSTTVVMHHNNTNNNPFY